MSTPKILNAVSKQLGDLPALLEQIVALVNGLAALGEQQDRIEAKLDQLLSQSQPTELSAPDELRGGDGLTIQKITKPATKAVKP